jgi:hypothetical protein
MAENQIERPVKPVTDNKCDKISLKKPLKKKVNSKINAILKNQNLIID